MIYPYHCPACDNRFEVEKRVSEIDKLEQCPTCQITANRQIGRGSLSAVNDWVESYNPAFGCVVKNKAHQREILARAKGAGKEFIEIGNEPVEKLHKRFDAQRSEQRKKNWDSQVSEQIIQQYFR